MWAQTLIDAWCASTNYFFVSSPSSENVIKLADVLVSPAVNTYQGGIILKYKAAYFLALEAESAASLIVIPALKKATVLLSVQHIYFGVAALVGVIGFAILVFYGGTPPSGGGRLLDSSVSSVTSTSCGSTVNIQGQSSLPNSVIDTSTTVSSDAVTTVLADVGGLTISTQPLIDQVLIAESALTGIVDSALVASAAALTTSVLPEVAASLAVASAAVLTTSALPEVAAATIELVPLIETELGFVFFSIKKLQITILRHYMQYEMFNSNGAPALTEIVQFLNNPHMTIMRDQLLRMGYDLTDYDANFQMLKDGAAKKPLGDFIVATLDDMLDTVKATFSATRDKTSSLYSKTLATVYKHILNLIANIDIEAFNKYPRQKPY